jgi:hypothetical protein
MDQKETRKPQSKTKMILMAMVILIGLALAVSHIMGPGSGARNRFVAEVRQTALADCDNDPECLKNIHLHFDDCLRDNFTSERSDIFTTTYNLDSQGLYDCLNDFQQNP